MGVVSIWREVAISTQTRAQFIDVTAQVKAEVAKSNIKNGFCYLFVPHTTAGLTINENTDPNVVKDIIGALERLVPRTGDFRHAEGNSDSHIKASMMGFSFTIPIINGNLNLGSWQGIYFCEFDGPRNRKLKIGLSGE